MSCSMRELEKQFLEYARTRFDDQYVRLYYDTFRYARKGSFKKFYQTWTSLSNSVQRKFLTVTDEMNPGLPFYMLG